jgi:soluble lytic murein transglycosylase
MNDGQRSPTQREQLLTLKIEQLRRLSNLHPGSRWAKRGEILLATLLIERDPGESIRLLRGAQPDFPVLDDYLRLWIGEALLKLGDATQAAETLESIPQAVPDSNLLAKSAYRTGDAWYAASIWGKAAQWYERALSSAEKDPAAPSALLNLADCQIRENKFGEARATLKLLWMRHPQSPEAREAKVRLESNVGGEPWTPSPEDYYIRAQAYFAQALQAEGVEEIRRFLTLAPGHPRRFEARLKLGIAAVRLKQYDLARDTFRALAAERVQESAEATVWLARVHLRQGQGDKLLELARSLGNGGLTGDQRAMVHLFAAVWLEDQGRYDESITMFQQVAKLGDSASQRAEGLWRVGWVQYRIARYQEAAGTFRLVAESHVNGLEPQAMYWHARASERDHRPKEQTADSYARVCDRYAYSYYCQLAAQHGALPVVNTVLAAGPVSEVSAKIESERLPEDRRAEIERHPAYRRALELKHMGFGYDASRELGFLTELYSRDSDVLLAFSTLLSEAGAYHPALRIAKIHFRDKLERAGTGVAPELWTVAYPTGLVPLIEAQGVKTVDPLLAAAIIREESQYDEKAVSMVGAIGLMQLMPVTANAVAQRYGFPPVDRDDLFDQETNIRLGVRYLGQLLEQFSGNIAYAVAAYNAGPLAVNNWIAMHRGRDQDEFVELIPYQETRLYVKRVLRSYGEYVRLRNSASTVPFS